MCLERVKGTRVATSAASRAAGCNRGQRNASPLVARALSERGVFARSKLDPSAGDNRDYIYPPSSSARRSVRSLEERLEAELWTSGNAKTAPSVESARSEEFDGKSVVPFFASTLGARLRFYVKIHFLPVTQDAHGESDACRRDETVGPGGPSKRARESVPALVAEFARIQARPRPRERRTSQGRSFESSRLARARTRVEHVTVARFRPIFRLTS